MPCNVIDRLSTYRGVVLYATKMKPPVSHNGRGKLYLGHVLSEYKFAFCCRLLPPIVEASSHESDNNTDSNC